MRLVLVRHGEAEPAGAGGDAARRLTAAGRAQAEGTGRGLVTLGVRPARILTSPLPRAEQTAQLLAGALGGPAPERWSALADSAAAELLAGVPGRAGDFECLLLVGHQPTLGEVLLLAIGQPAPIGASMGTGAAAALDFPSAVAAGAGRLAWLHAASDLARLGPARSGAA